MCIRDRYGTTGSYSKCGKSKEFLRPASPLSKSLSAVMILIKINIRIMILFIFIKIVLLIETVDHGPEESNFNNPGSPTPILLLSFDC